MKTPLRLTFACCLTVAAAFGWSTDASASSFQAVFAFDLAHNFGSPYGPMVEVNGRIYGTSNLLCEHGAIFQYDPASQVTSAVHNFAASDGCPVAGLATDGRGTIYGDTTNQLFSLDPTTNAVTTLFVAPKSEFQEPPVLDASGNLYGWRLDGNLYGEITKYNLMTGAATPACKFCGTEWAALLLNKEGTILYGSIPNLKLRHHFRAPGQIFKLDLASQAYSVLHVFSDDYDSEPVGPLVIDNAGILFGVTFAGGTPSANCSLGCGRIFKFDPGTQQETTLYSFKGGTDGAYPTAGITLGTNGQIYGTTDRYGGATATLFEFDLATGTHTVLHAFTGAEGKQFSGPPTLASDGSIYVANRSAPAPALYGYLFRYIHDAPSPLPPRHGGPVLPTSVTSDAGR